ncbi:hypothetical protein [Nocardia nova]|uniref:hypothetical protein n=1 Tax=Nocardia nova TaxID=37330 RepID=UPI0033C1FD47
MSSIEAIAPQTDSVTDDEVDDSPGVDGVKPGRADNATSKSGSVRRSISVSVSAIVVAVVVTALLALAAVLAVLLGAARHDLSDDRAAAADDRHAEQVATDYAVGASNIGFQDVNAWLAKLKANTTPELAAKFDATAPKLQDILVPLKWSSTSAPIAAKVTAHTGDVYKVSVFVNVTSTSAQNPQGAQTTVTYSVTVDRHAGWKISDVGGTEGALPVK